MIWHHCDHVAQVRTQRGSRVALLHLDAARPVVLEGTAAAIWDLIDGRRAQAGVIAELEASFEDAAGRLGAQVESFLISLEAQRLIEPARTTN